MDLDLQQFQQSFIEESLELLDGVEQTFLSFDEASYPEKETINTLFRSIHSIKGGSGTFGFTRSPILAILLKRILIWSATILER